MKTPSISYLKKEKVMIFILDYNFICNRKRYFMKKIRKYIPLVLAPFMMIGCNDSKTSSSDQTSSSNDISNEISSSESINSSEIESLWSDDAKELIIKYAGSLLPYPVSFSNNVSVKEITDTANNRQYLEILDQSDAFTLDDYHEDLEKDGWVGVTDYNDKIKQSDANGNVYYEFLKTSKGNSVGYDLTYFHSIDTETSLKYNVIQCFNDLETELDTATDWEDEEKEVFDNALSDIPPFLKFGKTNKVYQSSSNTLYCYDGCAIDLSKDNVDILKKAGYVLDETKSAQNSHYTLLKTLADNSKITAEVYYFSGNYVLFQYYSDIKESTTWPTSFTDSFKATSGFSLPPFEAGDIKCYFYYTKGKENTIYAFTEDTYLLDFYNNSLREKGLVYDYKNQWYVDWNENYYIKTRTSTDSITDESLVIISFGMLDETYDEFITGWPTSTIDKFLSDNKIETEYPEFNISGLSKYDNYRYEIQNYDDQYKYYYDLLKANSDYFDIDPDDEEAIVAKATSIAKNNTYVKIQVYDPMTKAESDGSYSDVSYPVLDYFKTTLTNACWCSVDNDDFTYESFEDASGKLLIGFDYAYGVTTITFTFGSGNAHTPTFKFTDSEIGLSAGDVYNLQLDVQMLPYKISFASDNEKISVDSDGKVTVASDAKEGEEATITASMSVPNEGIKIATCKITVTSGYDIRSAIQKVADKYNAYFNLTETDDGFAKPELIDKSNPDEDYEFKYYEMIITTSLDSLDKAKSIVTSNLIPAGFKNPYDGEWSDPSEFDDGTTRQLVTYSWYDENYNGVQLMFFVYLNPKNNAVTIMVKSLAI